MSDEAQDRDYSKELEQHYQRIDVEQVREIIAAIAEEGRVGLLKEVVPFVKHEEILDDVLACVDNLLSQASPLDFLFIDAGQRRWGSRTISEWSLKKASLHLLGHSGHFLSSARPVSSNLVAFAACHRSGFVRAKALKLLARDKPSNFGLAIAIIRCNDWVDTVRKLAQKVVKKNLTNERAADFAALLPLVLHLRSCGRDLHSSLVNKMCKLLQEGEGAPLLREIVNSNDAGMRWAALEVARGLNRKEASAFFLDQLKHKETNIRVASFGVLSSLMTEDAHLRLAESCLSDKSGQVRRKALLMLCQNPPSFFDEILDNSIFDDNRTVRWLSVSQLRSRFGKDPIPKIRDELRKEGSPHTLSCIAALGEFGSREDIPLLTQFLTTDRPALRAASVTAISRIDGVGTCKMIAEAIFDDSSKVSGAARLSLRRISLASVRDRLSEGLALNMAPHIRRNAFNLLVCLPSLDGLEFALTHLNDPDERIRKLSKIKLHGWKNRLVRFYERPPKSQVLRLLDLLGSDSRWEWLEGFLKSLLPTERE